MEFKGLPVSKGIAVERAYIYEPVSTDKYLEIIESSESSESGSGSFQRALARARQELRELCEKIEKQSPEQAKILRAHIEISEDETLIEDVEAALEDEIPLGEAVYSVFGAYIKMFAASAQERIRERVSDLSDVRNRILRILAGLPEQNLSSLSGPCVIFAHDLLPADTAGIDRENVRAIVTEIGGETSHTSIIARSYGIPCIVGVKDVCRGVKNGETVIADAEEGRVITGASEQEREAYCLRRDSFLRQREITERYRDIDCLMKDGSRVDICVNLARIDSQSLSAAAYTDGVGLLRTEFLYMGRSTQPSEQEQEQVYRQVLRAFGDKSVVLRTLDIGGDKKVECLKLPEEQNPFLGERALRLCFAQPELFRTQLRAALRASAAGRLWIMFPMVGSVEDFKKAKAMLLEEKAGLISAGAEVAEDIKIGAMIEIPSMALCSEALAAEADFASIGSNDLTQYLLAVDRTEPEVSKYCQKYHPAVWRAIYMAAQGFVRAGKPISVCGELGGDPLAAPALVGCGIRKLSMSAGNAAGVKQALSGRDTESCRRLAEALCSASCADEAEKYLKDFSK